MILLRSYILSEHEREMLYKFVHSGEKTYGFDVLRKRIRDYLPQIENDLILINNAKLKLNDIRIGVNINHHNEAS